jgi:hypothetical protein
VLARAGLAGAVVDEIVVSQTTSTWTTLESIELSAP